MDVKEATRAARDYVKNVFADDNISSVSLEEIEFDDIAADWRITISFLRPSGTMSVVDMVAPALNRGKNVRRCYKTVRINDNSGCVVSVKHRILDAAD